MKTGQSTGGIEQSPRYRRKKAREKAAEEARWKALNGPVVSYRIGDDVRPEDQSPEHDARSVEAAAE